MTVNLIHMHSAKAKAQKAAKRHKVNLAPKPARVLTNRLFRHNQSGKIVAVSYVRPDKENPLRKNDLVHTINPGSDKHNQTPIPRSEFLHTHAVLPTPLSRLSQALLNNQANKTRREAEIARDKERQRIRAEREAAEAQAQAEAANKAAQGEK